MSPKNIKQEKARNFRQKGLSLKEIADKLEVSKSSVSKWCSDISLTQPQQKRLRNKQQEGAAKGRKKAAKLKNKRKQERVTKYRNKGEKRVGEVSKRDHYISGLMLYSGEGDKKDGRIAIANTDPKIIKFMVGWFEKFFDVKPDSLKTELYIHDNLNVEKAINFWSKETSIPKDNFLDPYVVANNPDRLHKNVHEFGVLKVRFHNCNIHREIMGSIERILE